MSRAIDEIFEEEIVEAVAVGATTMVESFIIIVPVTGSTLAIARISLYWSTKTIHCTK